MNRFLSKDTSLRLLHTIVAGSHTFIYEVMMDAHRFLLIGELLYEAPYQAVVGELLGEADEPLDADMEEVL